MSRPGRFNSRDIAFIILLALASVLVRTPFLALPMVTDEGGYAYVAKFWSPEYQLYRDIPFDRPQAIFLLYRLAFVLFGTSIVSIRLFAAVFNALTVVAVTVLCRRALSAKEGWIAGGLFAVFSTAPFIEGFTANAETFMALPLVVSAYLTWRQRWFWAGLAGAVAVLLKPSAISALMLTLTWVCVTGAAWSGAAQVVAGFVVGVAPSAWHGACVGWTYYWQSVHERRLVLYNEETVGLAAQWAAIASGVHATVSSWLFPATAAALGGLRLVGRARWFGVMWLAYSLIGVAMGGWWREHYFIQLVAPLVFLGSYGLSHLGSQHLRVAWSAGLAGAIVIFAGWDMRLALLAPNEASWVLYHRPGYLLQNDVSTYIASTTREEDTIYVAFAEAELYYLSGRRAAVPQFYFLHAEYSADVFGSVVDAIAAGKPALVVVVQTPPAKRMSGTEFLALLDRRYAFDRAFMASGKLPMISVYRRRPDGRRGPT